MDRIIEMRRETGESLCPSTLPLETEKVPQLSGVLAGVPGSGRTSFLYQLANAWARAWSFGKPLAIYFSAREFLIYARNRRSVHEFMARQILPIGARYEIEWVRQALAEYEQSYGLLWLVDDLDRLPEADKPK